MKSLKIIDLAFLANLFLLTGLYMTYSEAQPPFIPRGNPLPQAQVKGACRIDPSITFTEEQTKKIENLERAYLEEAKPLWSEMRDLRLELRFAVSDPQVQPQALLDKQRRMSAIQAKFENLRFSYLIKARAIFTTEQLERMPPDCPLKLGTGYGAGRALGKRLQKGKPW
jgi:Spy/CpxP family protein refolding chaperone